MCIQLKRRNRGIPRDVERVSSISIQVGVECREFALVGEADAPVDQERVSLPRSLDVFVAFEHAADRPTELLRRDRAGDSNLGG